MQRTKRGNLQKKKQRSTKGSGGGRSGLRMVSAPAVRGAVSGRQGFGPGRSKRQKIEWTLANFSSTANVDYSAFEFRLGPEDMSPRSSAVWKSFERVFIHSIRFVYTPTISTAHSFQVRMAYDPDPTDATQSDDAEGYRNMAESGWVATTPGWNPTSLTFNNATVVPGEYLVPVLYTDPSIDPRGHEPGVLSVMVFGSHSAVLPMGSITVTMDVTLVAPQPLPYEPAVPEADSISVINTDTVQRAASMAEADVHCSLKLGATNVDIPQDVALRLVVDTADGVLGENASGTVFASLKKGTQIFARYASQFFETGAFSAHVNGMIELFLDPDFVKPVMLAASTPLGLVAVTDEVSCSLLLD